MKNCSFCCVPFNNTGKEKYCSEQCIKLNKNLKRKKEAIEFDCLICQNKFIQKRKDNLTCSTTCSQKLWVINNPNKNYERYNSVEAKERQKIWRADNIDKVRIIKNRYKQKRYNEDSLFKLKENVRNLIRNSFNKIKSKKRNKTEIILGCSFDEFKEYLESKFEDWMNWDNKGNPNDNIFELNKTWDLDHIIPLDTAITEEDVISLNHYTNYKPLCSYYNRFIKRNLYIKDF